MATLPTYDDTKGAVLNAIAAKNVRTGEIVSIMHIQLTLQPEFRANEVQEALNGMIKEGLITYEGGKFIKLAAPGYEQM